MELELRGRNTLAAGCVNWPAEIQPVVQPRLEALRQDGAKQQKLAGEPKDAVG